MKLLPCPSCGGKADFYREWTGQSFVECSGCGMRSKSVIVWNTRHIPEGYVLVPVEPTGAMVNVNPRILHPRIAKEIYQAMIAAAQAQQE